jgi:hypothetical protein
MRNVTHIQHTEISRTSIDAQKSLKANQTTDASSALAIANTLAHDAACPHTRAMILRIKVRAVRHFSARSMGRGQVLLVTLHWRHAANSACATDDTMPTVTQ